MIERRIRRSFKTKWMQLFLIVYFAFMIRVFIPACALTILWANVTPSYLGG